MTIFNQVSMIGTITHELEKKTHNGRSYVSFQMALNKKWIDKKSGEERSHASFIPVIAWGKIADHVCDQFTKGSFVFVSGELRSNSWETEKGERRSRTFVQASHAVAWATHGTQEEEEPTTDKTDPFADIDPINIDPDDIPF